MRSSCARRRPSRQGGGARRRRRAADAACGRAGCRARPGVARRAARAAAERRRHAAAGARHRARSRRAGAAGGLTPTTRVQTPVAEHRWLDNKVLVIRFTRFAPEVRAGLARALEEAQEARAIVVDLRGNGGGQVAMFQWFTGHFVAESREAFRLLRRDAPGGRAQIATPLRITAREPYLRQPLAVLIDNASGSAAELTAARARRGARRIAGRRTVVWLRHVGSHRVRPAGPRRPAHRRGRVRVDARAAPRRRAARARRARDAVAGRVAQRPRRGAGCGRAQPAAAAQRQTPGPRRACPRIRFCTNTADEPTVPRLRRGHHVARFHAPAARSRRRKRLRRARVQRQQPRTGAGDHGGRRGDRQPGHHAGLGRRPEVRRRDLPQAPDHRCGRELSRHPRGHAPGPRPVAGRLRRRDQARLLERDDGRLAAARTARRSPTTTTTSTSPARSSTWRTRSASASRASSAASGSLETMRGDKEDGHGAEGDDDPRDSC